MHWFTTFPFYYLILFSFLRILLLLENHHNSKLVLTDILGKNEKNIRWSTIVVIYKPVENIYEPEYYWVGLVTRKLTESCKIFLLGHATMPIASCMCVFDSICAQCKHRKCFDFWTTKLQNKQLAADKSWQITGNEHWVLYERLLWST